jgi:hypothetical protein
MAETVQGVLDDLRTESNVDATEPQLLRDLNRRWSAMLSDARAYRKVISIGNTVAGTAFYAVSATELFTLTVDGVPYEKARLGDSYAHSQDRLLWWPVDVGLAVPDADAAAVKGVTLIPTPGTSGLAIAGLAAVDPPELTIDAAGNTLLNAHLERDLIGPLTAGVLAERHWREHRPDLARENEARFDFGVEKLKRRARRRFRQAGPSQIRVA